MRYDWPHWTPTQYFNVSWGNGETVKLEKWCPYDKVCKKHCKDFRGNKYGGSFIQLVSQKPLRQEIKILVRKLMTLMKE